MRLFDVPITPPARLAPPFRFRVPFYRLASHRIPVLWHLYRALLRASPDELHRQATRVRWRKPERRSSTSPAATSAALVYEHRVLSDYITCRANPASLDQISHDRIASIRSEEETQTAIMQREDEAWKEYVSHVSFAHRRLPSGTKTWIWAPACRFGYDSLDNSAEAHPRAGHAVLAERTSAEAETTAASYQHAHPPQTRKPGQTHCSAESLARDALPPT